MIFLTPEEIHDMTGYQRHADQRRWLTGRGWLFEVSCTGRPIVGRAYAEQRLGFKTAPNPAVREEWKPNVAIFKKTRQ